MQNIINSIRIFLVDDEEDFRRPITQLLKNEGFLVNDFSSLEEMEIGLTQHKPNILILDVNLSTKTAFDVLPKYRKETIFGLILLTGRSTLEDRITGLEKGADAYLTKPVDIRELKANILSLQERLDTLIDNNADKWCLEIKRWTLQSPDKVSVKLTQNEYTMISMLGESPGTAVDRLKIYSEMGKDNPDIDDRALDVLISRLRKKFENSSYKLPLRSVRNVGYIFHDDILFV